MVSFDGQYVWSFPPRDGVRARNGWRVRWPAVMRDLLDGTACVRLSDPDGQRVHFEGPIAFRGNAEPLAFRDAHGHPLAVDKAGHLTRVFSETDDDVRRHIAEGTARAIADLRDRVGIDAHISYGCLLGAVRDGQMIGHDSDADLAYLSRRRTRPTSCASRSGWSARCARSAGRSSGCPGRTSSCSCPCPTAVWCTSTSSAPSTSGTPSTSWADAAGTSIARR